MATTKKNYYYVLVFTDEGPVYVTSVNNAQRISYWEREEEPKAFPKYYAEELVYGLNCNGYRAVLVSTKYEECQPYNYKDWNLTFVRKNIDEE